MKNTCLIIINVNICWMSVKTANKNINSNSYNELIEIDKKI